MSKAKRKHPAEAVSRSPSPVSRPDAAVLLSAVAEALNACEHAGITVRLAHGAVIADAGYVFAVGPDGAPWAVRSRTLTEFPAVPGEDD